MRSVIALAALALFFQGCAAIKPYEKEYLLSPLMDDGHLTSLSSPYLARCYGGFERLSAAGAGSAGTACPTCGG